MAQAGRGFVTSHRVRDFRVGRGQERNKLSISRWTHAAENGSNRRCEPRDLVFTFCAVENGDLVPTIPITPLIRHNTAFDCHHCSQSRWMLSSTLMLGF